MRNTKVNILITDIFYQKSLDVYSRIVESLPNANILVTTEKYCVVNYIKAKLFYKAQLFPLRKTINAVFNYDLYQISQSCNNQEIIYIPTVEDTNNLFKQFIQEKGNYNFYYLSDNQQAYNILLNSHKFNDVYL